MGPSKWPDIGNDCVGPSDRLTGRNKYHLRIHRVSIVPRPNPLKAATSAKRFQVDADGLRVGMKHRGPGEIELPHRHSPLAFCHLSMMARQHRAMSVSDAMLPVVGLSVLIFTGPS
jgi:hypothetical protein